MITASGSRIPQEEKCGVVSFKDFQKGLVCACMHVDPEEKGCVVPAVYSSLSGLNMAVGKFEINKIPIYPHSIYIRGTISLRPKP